MAAEEILYNALSGDSDITAIVDDRIYSDIRDQGDPIPAIHFDTDAEYTYLLSGELATTRSTCFITGFDVTREESESLADKIKTALSSADFFCTIKESGYEEETDDYSTTVQAILLETN